MGSYSTKHVIRTFVGMVILVICWLKMTHNLSDFQDLLATDEAYYMAGGLTLKGKLLKYWGPSYSLWYTVQAIFERDTIQLYYLNQKLMGLLPVVFIFVMLLTYKVNFFVSFIMSFFLMVSLIHFPTWPKISHFVVMVVCSGMILAKQFSSSYIKTCILTFCCLIAAYARPEFHLALILFVLILLFLLIKQRLKFTLIEWGFTTVLFFFIGASTYLLGNPFLKINKDNSTAKVEQEYDLESNRNIVAFAQHFALNYSMWNDLDVRNWMDYDKILKENFGEVTSYSEALKANPQMFFKQIRSNLKNYTFNLLNYSSDLLFPQQVFKLGFRGRIVAMTIILVILLVLYKRTWIFESIVKTLKENGFILFLLLVITCPTFISNILIFPRDHYIYLQLPLFFFLLTMVFQKVNLDKINLKIQLPIVALLGAFFFFVTPTAGNINYFNFWKGEQSNNNIQAIQKIKDICETEEVRMVQSEGVFQLFVRSKNFKIIQPTDWSNLQFLNHIKSNDINLIYCSVMLLKNPFIQSDSLEWNKIISSPSKYGWHKITFNKGSQEFMLIRDDLWSAYQAVKK